MTDLGLRPLRVDDAAEMAEVLADPSLYEFTGGEPPSVAALERRYAVQTRGRSADGSEQWVNEIVEVDGRAVGYVQATIPADGATEIAWVIGAPFQDRGYARQAARLLIEQLADRGVTEVVAHPPRPHRLPAHRGRPGDGRDARRRRRRNPLDQLTGQDSPSLLRSPAFHAARRPGGVGERPRATAPTSWARRPGAQTPQPAPGGTSSTCANTVSPISRNWHSCWSDTASMSSSRTRRTWFGAAPTTLE